MKYLQQGCCNVNFWRVHCQSSSVPLQPFWLFILGAGASPFEALGLRNNDSNWKSMAFRFSIWNLSSLTLTLLAEKCEHPATLLGPDLPISARLLWPGCVWWAAQHTLKRPNGCSWLQQKVVLRVLIPGRRTPPWWPWRSGLLLDHPGQRTVRSLTPMKIPRLGCRRLDDRKNKPYRMLLFLRLRNQSSTQVPLRRPSQKRKLIVEATFQFCTKSAETIEF